MADTRIDDRTWTSAATAAQPEISKTRTIHDLVDHVGQLRIRARLLNDDVTGIHREAFRQQLDARARQLAKQTLQGMLTELADAGFAWRDIARLTGVSVPALRRWRQGETPTGQHRLVVARLLALVETLRDDHLISDVASWMEMPLSNEAPLTAIDLASHGRYEDVFDLAADHLSAEQVLDEWQPDWRTRYRSDFEVFEAEDGDSGIRLARRESAP